MSITVQKGKSEPRRLGGDGGLGRKKKEEKIPRNKRKKEEEENIKKQKRKEEEKTNLNSEDKIRSWQRADAGRRRRSPAS